MQHLVYNKESNLHFQKTILFLLAIFPVIWGASKPAWAASESTPNDIYTLPKVVALQNRQYYLNKELTLSLGYVPLDAFTKNYTIGGSYTYYLSDFVGWEVVNAHYAGKIDTGLKNDLINYYNVRPVGILDYMTYYATTGFIYTPLYTKNLLFNKSVVQGETSFVFDGGIANYNVGGMQGLVGGGIILRFFTRENRSLKFDIRTHVRFGTLPVDMVLTLNAGYAFELSEPKTVKSDEEANAQLQ